MYVSALFSLDPSQTKRSLISVISQCDYLKVGDGLMVDKGFLTEKEVENIGLKLNIPPFARSNCQMSHQDVEMTKKIAKHRVHVERAIAKIKKGSQIHVLET